MTSKINSADFVDFSPAQVALQNRIRTKDRTTPLILPEVPRNLSGSTLGATPNSTIPATGGLPPSSVPDFVSPSSFLRPWGSISGTNTKGGMAVQPARQGLSPTDREQLEGLRKIRGLLRVRTGYDVLPISYRLIVLDTALLVKASLNVMTQNAIVSAPLWDSRNSTFAGLITAHDYINVVQYYWQNPGALSRIDQFRLDALPEIEKAIGVTTVETISIHPERPLYEACKRMLESRARRIPLVDIDDETQRAMVVSVITQYRILKFIAVNTPEIRHLRKPLRDLRIGTYGTMLTCTMDTPVIEVIHMLVKKNISSVPIVDENGAVLNIFEAVDVITIIKGSNYDELNMPVGEAILKRNDDFEGIHTCSMNDCLATVLDTVRRSRVHRFVIIGEQDILVGILTLSDILQYLLNEGATDDEP